MARINSLAITFAAIMAVAMPVMGQANPLGRVKDILRAISAPAPPPADGQEGNSGEDNAATADADEQLEGIHLKGGGSEFQRTDGQGFMWDITGNGTVNDGSRDAYDGGISLMVAGQTFGGGNKVTGADSHEIEIGPWQTKSINVWRRVYVDPDTGYCRWIDIFQNTTDEPVEFRVVHMSTLGASPRDIYRPATDRGKTPSPVNWGLATKDSPSASRPAIAHIWGTPNSTNIPAVSVTLGSTRMTFAMKLELAPGETSAVCVFQAQRSNMGGARQFLDNFDHEAELAKIPPALRDIIINMQTNILIAGPVALQRSNKADLLVLHDGTTFAGKLLNEQFVVETFYGQITLSADQVMGLGRADLSDQQVHVALTDGQIIAGRLTSGPMKLQKPDETVMTVPVERLTSVAFAISEARPASVLLDAANVQLQSGQQLIFQTGPQQLTYFTEHGQLTLPTDMLEYVDLAADGQLHMAKFINGSRLSGVLVDKRFDFALQLGPSLAVDRDVVARVRFNSASEDQPDGTAVMLKNGDIIYGKLAAESLEVQTPYGPVTILIEDIRKITIQRDDPLGQVRIELHEQPAVTGKLASEALSFAIADGTTLEVFVGLIAEVTLPKPVVEQPAQETSSNQQTYTVQEGDTFWIVAKNVYGEGRHWPVIAKANPNVTVATIKAGDELSIPPLPDENTAPNEDAPPDEDVVPDEETAAQEDAPPDEDVVPDEDAAAEEADVPDADVVPDEDAAAEEDDE